jgi:hypothetical protein
MQVLSSAAPEPYASTIDLKSREFGIAFPGNPVAQTASEELIAPPSHRVQIDAPTPFSALASYPHAEAHKNETAAIAGEVTRYKPCQQRRGRRFGLIRGVVK